MCGFPILPCLQCTGFQLKAILTAADRPLPEQVATVRAFGERSAPLTLAAVARSETGFPRLAARARALRGALRRPAVVGVFMDAPVAAVAEEVRWPRSIAAFEYCQPSRGSPQSALFPPRMRSGQILKSRSEHSAPAKLLEGCTAVDRAYQVKESGLDAVQLHGREAPEYVQELRGAIGGALIPKVPASSR